MSEDVPQSALCKLQAELILLSPYRVPGQHTMYLADEEVACFLNGHSALWHPALALPAIAPPRVASPYDHENPTAGQVFAVPESPTANLPDDWEERARQAGAVFFRATPDRQQTLENLKEALRSHLGPPSPEPAPEPAPPPEPPQNEGHTEPAPDLPLEQVEQEPGSVPPAESAPAFDPVVVKNVVLALLELEPEHVAPFFGLGFGLLHLDALFEAQDHENLIDHGQVWLEVKQAVQAVLRDDAEAYSRHLREAANRLLTAREVLYTASIHLLELRLLTPNNLDSPLEGLLEREVPVNLLTPSLRLREWAQHHPERLELLRRKVEAEVVEVCGGCEVEREDALLPVESQLWNLSRGLATAKELLGKDVRVFARQRFGFVPQTPSLLNQVGIQKAVYLTFDEATLPSNSAAVVSWPAPDGKHVTALCRAPQPSEGPQTYFHVAYHLHQTIMQDHSATLVLAGIGRPAPWLDDWLELSKLAPVLGQWMTLSRYLDEVHAGDYASPAPADDFHGDYLTERANDVTQDEASSYSGTSRGPVVRTVVDAEARRRPVSAFAWHARVRRKIDSAWTLSSIHQSLGGPESLRELQRRLAAVEDAIERRAPACLKGTAEEAELAEVSRLIAEGLAGRLLSRPTGQAPGWMVLNPCSFTRRVVLDLDNEEGPLSITGPVKASQVEEGRLKVVAEVPPLGFAWLPRKATPGITTTPPRLRMADERCVRNEFLEAEIDPNTGGLRAIRDTRTRINRMGQRLVYNPGSLMRLKSLKTTSTGPAFGEIIAEGILQDENEQTLATWRQRYRAWLGRPVLDLRIEIFPQLRPQGYPWHAYYGCQFAWADERSTLLRGVNGLGYLTAHTRPESPDFLEVRHGKQATVVLTGGLPFHQRQGGRMVDLILVPEGEIGEAFEIALALDRDYPSLTALGLTTPPVVVPVPAGPPHVGASGWLYHLDVPNLTVTSLRPGPEGSDAILARFLECGNQHGHAEFRCVRDPARAQVINLTGEVQMELGYSSDAVMLDLAEGELVTVRVDFSLPEEPAAAENEQMPTD